MRQSIMASVTDRGQVTIPAEVRKNMVFTFVATMDEVLRLAMLPPIVALPADLPPVVMPESEERRSSDAERSVPIETGD